MLLYQDLPIRISEVALDWLWGYRVMLALWELKRHRLDLHCHLIDALWLDKHARLDTRFETGEFWENLLTELLGVLELECKATHGDRWWELLLWSGLLEAWRILAVALLGHWAGGWSELGIHIDGVLVECYSLLQILKQIEFRLIGKDLRDRPFVEILLWFIVSERHRCIDLRFLILLSLLRSGRFFDILESTHCLNIDEFFGSARLFELRNLIDIIFLSNWYLIGYVFRHELEALFSLVLLIDNLIALIGVHIFTPSAHG